MPRPRVLPSQRRRVAEACSFCREAKKRCSGTAPCTHCLRRGISSQCTITPNRLRAEAGGSGSAAGARPMVRHAEPISTSGIQSIRDSRSAAAREGRGRQTRQTNNLNTISARTPNETPPSSLNGEDDSRAEPSRDHPLRVSVSPNPHPRMLLNSRGEKVYIGGAASLSFLQLVRGVVADQIGPSQFSHNDKSHTMLEQESPSSSRNVASLSALELDAEQKLEFVRAYQAVTEGFMDVFAASELDALSSSANSGQFDANLQQRATVGLVIAIGAQAKSASTARDIGQAYFRQAQCLAFSGMLEDPDLDMVRCFLLMAYYLLGECRRNSAFMYLGIATRAAVALGLHSRESYTDMTDTQDLLRVRVWISLRVVDMLANSILGRPAATAGLQGDITTILELSSTQGDSAICHIVASHRVVSIINGIVDTMYEKKEVSIAGVEQLLREIKAWAKDLPDSLRSTSIDPETFQDGYARGAIGGIHVSCLYYFAITLATRPMLISALTAQPASSGASQANLASACLDAAVYLVQTCVEGHKSNLLYGNMCIMKALVFAAGLVLGFEMFAKQSIDYGIESAFHGAKDVLQFLAAQSPQAAHYFEILTLLSNVIAEQRQKIAAKGRSKWVSKLFTLNRSQQHNSRQRGTGFTNHDALEDLGEGTIPLLGDGMAWFSNGQSTAADSEQELFLGWDSLDISQWDNFPFVQ